MMRNKKKIRIVLIVAVLFLLGFILSNFLNAFYRIMHSYKQGLVTSDSILNNDCHLLFSEEAIRDISSFELIKPPMRIPFEIIAYRKKYEVLEYKMDSNSLITFKNIIIENASTDLSSQVVYNELPFISYTFNYPSEKPSKVDGLYLKINADSILNSLKTDSDLYYNLKLRDISLSYEPNGIRDIVLKAKSKFFEPNPWISILFIKRNKALYLLVFSSKQKDDHFDKNMLLNMIRH